MSVDAPTEPFRPTVQTNNYYDNDFGFGNMQTMDEEDYEHEPPLLEELGIDFSHILNKILVVINPRKRIDSVLVNDADLTGPILFCFILSVFMLLKGHIQFGYTFGFFFMGCFLIYVLLNLLNEKPSTNISLTLVTSILGYSIIPLVLLALYSVFLSTRNIMGLILGIFCVVWSSYSASRFIELLLGSKDQRYIIMYPLLLLYATFG
ncbi:hypothetical protein WA538_004363, partial [Blastocystis sp. DL]